MPARFRNSFETPSPLVANRPTKLSYVMPGVVHTFKKGHRIMVQIQSTWFPLVARNPQKFMAELQARHGRRFSESYAACLSLSSISIASFVAGDEAIEKSR